MLIMRAQRHLEQEAELAEWEDKLLWRENKLTEMETRLRQRDITILN